MTASATNVCNTLAIFRTAARLANHQFNHRNKPSLFARSAILVPGMFAMESVCRLRADSVISEAWGPPLMTLGARKRDLLMTSVPGSIADQSGHGP
jgi:hypothetical protein